ncbi:hypothetical protein [Burkholderia territorii]|nr:hypothetical protein [Burkholderia territorii]
MTNDLSSIEDICANMRSVFERVLTISDIKGVSGTCLYAAILLQQSLEKFCACEAVVRGGDGGADGGARDVRGGWHGHYWVEGVCGRDLPFLADITADQFGWPPVVVLHLAVARDRYVPGDDSVCGRAVDAEIDRMLGAVRVDE